MRAASGTLAAPVAPAASIVPTMPRDSFLPSNGFIASELRDTTEYRLSASPNVSPESASDGCVASGLNDVA